MQSRGQFSIAKSFRLRGVVGGLERTFPLRSGKNAIGRGSESEVRIQAKGVSHLHAVLFIEPGSLRLEDQHSKNGSFVNGTAVLSTHLEVGDRLWFGSTELVLEEVEGGEMELAVDLGSPASQTLSSVASPAGDTPTRRRWLDGKLVSRWFAAVEAFVERSGEPDALPSVSARVGAILGAQGAAVLELDGSASGVLMASSGEPDEALVKRLTAYFGQTGSAPAAPSSRTRFGSWATGRSAVLTAAILEEPDERPLVVALFGDFPGRAECEPVLVILVRLVRRLYSPRTARGPAPHRRVGARLVFPADYVPGTSAAIQELHTQMEPLGQGDLPVLISGETGVGKEHVARILHASSDRHGGPFVAINCAAVPAELLEAELFGIGKGVATGVSARLGRFLQAQGGTLFLDEIGDLPEALQPKLLRALEERSIQPVGDTPVPIDVRIVAATNTDLRSRLGAGGIRADLYYRLAGVELRIPPLRQRRDDIPILVEHFLRRISEEIDKPIRGITVKALKTLVRYSWPGNVRELVHEIRRLVYVSPEGEAVESSRIAEHIRDGQPRKTPSEEGEESSVATATEEAQVETPSVLLESWLSSSSSLDLTELECSALEEALRRTGGNQVQAGHLLGISRMAVRRRMERCRKRKTSAEAADPSG